MGDVDQTIVIDEPLVIEGYGNGLKAEIIKEYTQLLTLEEAKDKSFAYGTLIYDCGPGVLACRVIKKLKYYTTLQYDIKVGDSISVPDRRTVRFQFNHNASFEYAYYFTIDIENNDSTIYVFNKDSKKVLWNVKGDKTLSFNMSFDKTIPKGPYIISVWSGKKQSVSINVVAIKQQDMLLDEQGAIWIIQEADPLKLIALDNEYKVVQLFKLKWYLPIESVGILKGVLERKIAGESDELIRQIYGSGGFKTGLVVLSFVAAFLSMISNIILAIGGAMLSLNSPSDKIETLYWEVNKVTGLYRDGATEKFKNGCVMEIYDQYEYNPLTPSADKESKLRITRNIIKVSKWENPKEPMTGGLGIKGKFILNTDPDAAEAFEIIL